MLLILVYLGVMMAVAVLCYAMLCSMLYAMLCYAMLCYAMLCYALWSMLYAMLMLMLCYAMLCYAMLCYAMLCYAMLCYAMLCYAMLCCGCVVLCSLLGMAARDAALKQAEEALESHRQQLLTVDMEMAGAKQQIKVEEEKKSKDLEVVARLKSTLATLETQVCECQGTGGKWVGGGERECEMR